MLVLEIKKLIKRKEYRIMLLIMWVVVCLDFLAKCKYFYGQGISNVFPAYQLAILEPAYMSRFGVFFAMFLPLIVGFMGVDSHVCDVKKGINTCIMTRINRIKYLKNKAKALFFVVFITVEIVLIVGVFLTIITFPLYGYNLNGGQLPDIIVDKAWYEGLFLGYFKYKMPYVGLMIFITIRSIYAGVFALFGYGVSLCIPHVKYISIAAPFIVYTGTEMFQLLAEKYLGVELPFLGTTYPLQTYPRVNFLSFLLPFALFVGLFLVTFSIGTRREDL